MGQYVLIADDDPDVLTMVTDILDAMGVEARQVRDGYAALQMAKGELPAAIILDLMMPVMNGTDFLEEVRTDPDLKGLSVIILSAYVDQYEYNLREKPGVIGVLSKGSASADELRELLNQALS